jgi:hypothetical protein
MILFNATWAILTENKSEFEKTVCIWLEQIKSIQYQPGSSIKRTSLLALLEIVCHI